MPTGNSNGMTAKIALSNLKGDVITLKGDLVQANRFGDSDHAAALEKQIAVKEYAIAAVQTFVASGKSALKAAAALNG